MSSTATADAHSAELDALALRRLPFAIVVLLGVIALAFPIEAYFDPSRIVPYLAVYVLEVVISAVACMVAVRHPRKARTVAVTWGSVFALCVAAYYPLVRGDAILAMTALICLVSTLPTMLPFGLRQQAVLSVVTVGGFVGILWWGVPLSLHWPYVFVAFLTVVVTSTTGAGLLSRFRFEAFTREASLRDAHVQLRTALARAEDAVDIRSRLVANVSHELRTPINIIVGYADMLTDAGGEPELIADLARRIRDHGASLEALVRDLLDLSRLTCTKIELSIEDVDVGTLLDDAARGARHLIAERPVDVRVECSVASVRSDRMRLAQIVHNLAANAAKFTSAGSIVLRAGSNGDGTWIEVTDTGCGIPAEEHERIFRAFEQVTSEHAGAARGGGGVGLGLAIVRQLVDVLGGTIAMTSRVGVGSRFTVVLPASAVPGVAGRAWRPRSAPGEGEPGPARAAVASRAERDERTARAAANVQVVPRAATA